jgi:selenocysteine lyase/cysteine desulfurase
MTGIEPLANEDAIEQMVAAELPRCDPGNLQRRLWDEHRIEIPVREVRGRILIRASFQGYNDERDLDALLNALRTIV